MSSQLRVDNILPSAGTALGIGTVSGSITFNSNISGDTIFNDDVTINGVLTYEDVTNIDSVGVVTARSDIYLGNDIYLTDGSSGYEKVEVDSNDIRVEQKHIHSEFGVWTRSTSVNDRRLGIEGAGNDLLLYANSAEKVRITSAGNVGINKNNPDAALVVYDTAGSLGSTKELTAEFRRADGTYNPRLQIRHSSDGTDINHTWSTNAGNFTFSNAGTEVLRIISAGNLGIGGLTNPGALLSIPAGESNTPRLAIESAVDNNDFTITQYEDGNGTYTMLGQNVKLNSGGNNTILDSGHRTAGILFDARNHGAITFLTGGTNAVSEPLKITSAGQLLHTRSDNTTRYDLEFRQTGGITDGNYSGIHWTQGSTGSTNLAAIEIEYATNGRPDIVFKTRQSSGTSMSEAVRINSSGNLAFPSGQGIDFSATSDSSEVMSSELFDDYEEGTWTPTMGFATGYGTQSGKYVKVGKTVHIWFEVQVTGWSTGTGSTRITSSPFPIDKVTGCWAGVINAAATTRDWRVGPWTAGGYGMGVWMENGQGSATSAGIRMSENTFSDYSSLTGSLGTNFTMRGGMTYISTV